MRNEQYRFVWELARKFGRERFDASDVAIEAGHNQRLAVAIEAAVPRCRYKSGYHHEFVVCGFNYKAIEMELRRLTGKRKPLWSTGHDHRSFRVRPQDQWPATAVEG
jgi:hypothetical protein